MLHVGTAPTAKLGIGSAQELAVGIHLVDDVRVGIAHVGLIQVDDVPALSSHIVALVLHGALAQDDAEGVLSYLLVVGQRVLHLPVGTLVPRAAGQCVLALGIARMIVFRERGVVVAPEGHVYGVVEVIFQVVPELQVDGELWHELVAPVFRGVQSQHGQGVVHFAVAAKRAGHGVVVSGGVALQLIAHGLLIVFVILLGQGLAGDGGSEDGREVEGRAQHRAELRVLADARALYASVGHVHGHVELVQEVALLRLVEHGVDIVRAEAQALIVRLSEVAAHDALLVVVAQGEIVVQLLGGAADAQLMVLHRSIVVEHQLLPVGAEALDGVAVGVGQVGRIQIKRSLAAIEAALVLHDGIVGGTGHVALLPRILPAHAKVIVDAGLALLAFLRGNQDDAVGSPGTVDGTRGSVLQHLYRLNVGGIHKVNAAGYGHAIDDVEGVRIGNCTCTSNTHTRRCARLAR